MYAEIDFTSDLGNLEWSNQAELDAVRLGIEIECAKKLELKGQKKRACDANLDALYLP